DCEDGYLIIKPVKDSDGNWTFTTDQDFKIMQITDVHLGGGSLSGRQDRMAVNAIAAMITYEKPDLVVVTGDVAFAVPFISGTINNKNAHDIFTTLMDKLGVYYTITFGNHDSENYDYYNRSKVASFYEDAKHSKCLFTRGPEDIYGESNQIIKIKKTNGLINKALFIVDSNSYLPEDKLGIGWKYDNVHEDQIEWYCDNVDAMSTYNASKLTELGLTDTDNKFTTVQSFVFQHIPLKEYKTAYLNENPDDTTYLYGENQEDHKSNIVYCPINEDQFFEKMVEKGSTKAMFCGHDHLNNAGYKYKGIELSYGMSIDYLAYFGIGKYGKHRGCSSIMVNADSTYETIHNSYYDDKYVPKYPKEKVSMDLYYKDNENN
ncbi:MAG: metallophosphoesterase, partial [Bacilli bacterium]|nr:metallophosphoesterase [Bacilli bacterium]